MYIQEELSIKAMTISQIYSLYANNKLVVNRKYQRKLCWTIEEKRNFLDTIERGLPVPMFLFAATDDGQYEIIDGMQRLDAICSFISQKYALKDGHFNLESMPDTIEQKRKNQLKQKKPIVDASICKSISNYPLPVSIFPAASDEDVEEIFKRINSTGKHLALQELRQVGVDTQFATIIRQLSSEIRGDISEDKLLLKNMSNISLSNYRLPYSIFIDDIFWVKNGIINGPEIRQSRDEEALAFIVANMILPQKNHFYLNTMALNKLYGYSPNPLNIDIPIEMTQVNNAIDRIGLDFVMKQFRIVMSCIEEMLNVSQKTFRQMMGISKTVSDLIVPFQIIFMAIHRLIITEKRGLVDYHLLASKIDGKCSRIVGGNIQNRESAIDAVYGLIQAAFTQNSQEDPALDDWSLDFVNILNKSKTEQVLYDFKIGFVPLNETKIDVSVVNQVLKTLTAINNIGPNRTGYVIIGIANDENAAKKYATKYGIDYTLINDFPLCGIEHDATAISQDLDRYTHTIKEFIRNSQDIPEAYRMHLLTQMKTPMVYGKHTFVFKTCYTEPVPFGNDYYLREFTDVNKLTPEQIPNLFTNYYRK
ncbi:DUF262 domain-containing protein [Acutalibacter sp. 1XD8-33]|uniref:DUF262 domain-containing protein n=1 Tax=Acutalibacter sp. 1XD8-33 TaxID=2320081 RepID=UPI000EA342B0|nr:DUF262 domain-containing protein [Acutalibacter sp. 1XD8-33]RKJ38454.1 DUF262 domain-containing protein [Acutalibacter sp. 1XD8-33]